MGMFPWPSHFFKAKASKAKIYTSVISKYVQMTDLIGLLNQEFFHLASDGITRIVEYTVETSIEGSHRVLAPRAITEEEIRRLQELSALRGRAAESVWEYGG